MVLATGLIASTCAFGAFFSYLSVLFGSNTFAFAPFQFIIGRLYLNSMLAALNMRSFVRGQMPMHLLGRGRSLGDPSVSQGPNSRSSMGISPLTSLPYPMRASWFSKSPARDQAESVMVIEAQPAESVLAELSSDVGVVHSPMSPHFEPMTPNRRPPKYRARKGGLPSYHG